LALLFLLIAGCGSHDPESGPEEGYVHANGVDLYYLAVGNGEPIIVLHGGPGGDHHHMSQLTTLSDQYRVIFYDQRATGESGGDADSLSITSENFVEDLEGLRQALGLESVTLIGASWGGLLALQYGVRYPERLRAVILLGPGPARRTHLQQLGENIYRNTAPEDRARLAEIAGSEAYKRKDPGTFAEYLRLWMKAYFYDKSLVDRVDWTLGRRTAENFVAVNDLIWSDLGDFDIRASLSKIDCPVLIIHGVADPMPLISSYEIHDAIPGSKFYVVEKAGHGTWVEAPETVFGLIRQFLADPGSVQSHVPAGILTQLEESS